MLNRKHYIAKVHYLI